MKGNPTAVDSIGGSGLETDPPRGLGLDAIAAPEQREGLVGGPLGEQVLIVIGARQPGWPGVFIATDPSQAPTSITTRTLAPDRCRKSGGS